MLYTCLKWRTSSLRRRQSESKNSGFHWWETHLTGQSSYIERCYWCWY
jgi:hypothetical protein